MVDIKSLNLDELTNLIVEKGFKKFRAKQAYDWMHKKCVESVEEMSNIPGDLKEWINRECDFCHIKIADVLTSGIDGTKKYLFELADGNVIESVFMRYKHGNSVCISSQVGCRMGCKFCASTLGGLVRNLSPAEMLEQIYEISKDTGERVSNVVVMGSGEPLDNFDNICKFIELVTDENGLNISQRNITISTCGIVPKIKELAQKNYQITLALSLHATTDEKRKEIMPIANSYTIDEILDACRYYFDKTGRRVTFEYSLAKGVNDSFEDAKRLVSLVKNINSHVNLIPVNPVKERDFSASDKKNVEAFKKVLEDNKINATVRREMGRDINGACGQLRRDYIKKNT